MSVTATLRQMATGWRTITGIKTVFDYIPRVIQDGDCPALIIFPNEATYDLDSMGDNDLVEGRLYLPTLYVAPAFMGTEQQGQIQIEPFFDRVRDYWVGRPGLEVDGVTLPQDVVYNAEFRGDSGYQALPYPLGGENLRMYHAIQWRHFVKEWIAVAYRD